jgi:hypothetical protein
MYLTLDPGSQKKFSITFLLKKNMIHFMSNMPSNYINSSCRRRTVFLNTMWCSLMGVLVNSKAHDLGSSYLNTIIPQFLQSYQVDAKWHGTILLLAMGRERWMEQELCWSKSCRRNNWNPMVWRFKMHMKQFHILEHNVTSTMQFIPM